MKKFFSIIALLLAISVLFVFGCKDPEVPVEPPGETEAPEKPGDTETGGNQSGDNTETGGNQSGDNTGAGGNQPGDTETGENQPGDNSGTGGNQPGDNTESGGNQSGDNSGTGENQPGDNTESGGNQPGDNTGDNDDSDDVLVPNSITLTVSSGLVYVGETATVTSSVTLSDGSTVNPEITTTGKSTVSGNVLTANSVGTETITATYEGLSTSVNVKIKEKITNSIFVHVPKNLNYTNAYAWIGESTELLGGWPGTTMTDSDNDDYYEIEINQTSINIIFNGSGQTKDLIIESTGEYWYIGGKDGSGVFTSDFTDVDPTTSKDPVTSTENASGSGNDSSDDNQDSGDINQGGSSGDNNDDNENQGGSSGGSTGGESSDPIVTDYYWTNKDGAVGTNKTISSWSDWTEAERIAQNAAYDDPRTWLGIQEVPYDVYALYAAYDDTNLYIMVELTNIVDRASFMWHDYAGSDNAWWNNRDIPLGMLFNTGKGIISTKPTVGSKNAPIWDSVDFSDTNGFDAMFYHSSKYGTFEGSHVGVGTPGFFKTTSEGNFSYDSNYCLSFNAGSTIGTSGISVKYQRKCAVSKKIYYESTPTGNRGESGQTGESLINSTTYTAVDTNDLDMSYWYTIPLSTLGIDKNYIQTKGIGIRQITTGGGSLMDCSPWDPSMVDAATEPYSKVDDNTSHEKEDCDDMTTPLARIGKM